jgi:AraC-like DNA-binding protein
MINVANPGKVWHDLSSSDMTVAVLLDQVGGLCETRFNIHRPLNRSRYGTGQINFVPAGIPVWGYADKLHSTRGLRLYFNPDALDGLLGDDWKRATAASPRLMEYDDRVTRCASLLADECSTSALGSMYGESLTLALTAALFTPARLIGETNRFGLGRAQLMRALEYFEAHLAQEIALKDVAAEVGLSPSRFARAFKISTGIAPYRWYMEARIRKAKQLLLRRTTPLSEVAKQTGFADQSHFTRAFRRVTGSSPRLWQRDQ